MKGSQRTLLLVLPVIALAIGFWMLVLSPKQQAAKDAEAQVETLQASLEAAESEIAIGEQARAAFSENYSDLVELGSAVPEDDDQATLIHDLSALARRDGVNFRSFQLVPGEAAPAAAPTTPTAPTAEAPPAETAAVPAAATEATAATLPLGATVGPAGLPVTPYQLKYFGPFFNMADLFASLDKRVRVRENGLGPKINGRLMTVDGFALQADPIKGFPRVQAEVSVTTFLVPAEQGISAGATPVGPAPVDPATTVEAGGTSTTPATTTAAVTP